LRLTASQSASSNCRARRTGAAPQPGWRGSKRGEGPVHALNLLRRISPLSARATGPICVLGKRRKNLCLLGTPATTGRLLWLDVQSAAGGPCVMRPVAAAATACYYDQYPNGRGRPLERRLQRVSFLSACRPKAAVAGVETGWPHSSDKPARRRPVT
jgi:hypothetical protein